MKHALLVLLLVLCAVGTRSQAQQPVGPWANPASSTSTQAPERPHVSIMPQPSGEPILVVDYPWHRHRQVSIEMRLLEEGEPDAKVWQPIFFVANYLNDEATKAIYRCQTLGRNLPATGTFSILDHKQTIEFEVLGKRNSMDRSAVVTHCVSKLEGPRGGTRLIFWPIEEWALDRRTLWLELPKKDFSKPCRLRIWFLRGDDIVWSETIAWPGIVEKKKGGEAEGESPKAKQ